MIYIRTFVNKIFKHLKFEALVFAIQAHITFKLKYIAAVLNDAIGRSQMDVSVYCSHA